MGRSRVRTRSLGYLAQTVHPRARCSRTCVSSEIPPSVRSLRREKNQPRVGPPCPVRVAEDRVFSLRAIFVVVQRHASYNNNAQMGCLTNPKYRTARVRTNACFESRFAMALISHLAPRQRPRHGHYQRRGEAKDEKILQDERLGLLLPELGDPHLFFFFHTQSSRRRRHRVVRFSLIIRVYGVCVAIDSAAAECWGATDCQKL